MAIDNKSVEHRVILRITPGRDQKALTEKQLKRMLEQSFRLFQYGEVRVVDVLNEEKRRE